jgi:hypothetical protein
MGPMIEHRLSPLLPSQERERDNILTDFGLLKNDITVLFCSIQDHEEVEILALIKKIDINLHYPQISDNKVLNKYVIGFEAACEKLYNLLVGIKSHYKSVPVFVIDSSAFIDCPNISLMLPSGFTGESLFIIPTTTIKELEDLKSLKRDEEFRRKLSIAIKHLTDLSSTGNAHNGIKLENDKTLKMLAEEPDFSNLPNWLDPQTNDDRIIASAITLQQKYPFSTVTLISNDIGMQLKATHAKIPLINSPILNK